MRSCRRRYLSTMASWVAGSGSGYLARSSLSALRVRTSRCGMPAAGGGVGASSTDESDEIESDLAIPGLRLRRPEPGAASSVSKVGEGDRELASLGDAVASCFIRCMARLASY